MDIVAGHIYRWTVVQNASGSVMYNTWDTACQGTFGNIDLANVAAAYWNNFKTQFRGIYPTDAGNVFVSLLWRDLTDETGAFGEYAIPTNERTGLRPPTAQPEYAASFIACGVRLTVGTRVTRPGQKRFYGITEGDISGNYFQAAYLAAVTTLAANLSSNAVLGAPATGVQLQPVVARLDEQGAVVTTQPVTGYLVNSVVTSQRSRRLGHGI